MFLTKVNGINKITGLPLLCKYIENQLFITFNLKKYITNNKKLKS